MRSLITTANLRLILFAVDFNQRGCGGHIPTLNTLVNLDNWPKTFTFRLKISIIKLVYGKRNGKLKHKFVTVHRRFVNPLSFFSRHLMLHFNEAIWHNVSSSSSSYNKWIELRERNLYEVQWNRVRSDYVFGFACYFLFSQRHVACNRSKMRVREKKANDFINQIMQTATHRSFIERNAYNLATFFLLHFLWFRSHFSLCSNVFIVVRRRLPTVYLFIHKY